MATITQYTTNYADLDAKFVKHPLTGDVSLRLGIEAVKASLKHLILGRIYERPFFPELSSGVSDLLFELWDPATRARAHYEIELVVRNYEPRVQLLGIKFDDSRIDSNSLAIQITFLMIATGEQSTVNIVVERNR